MKTDEKILKFLSGMMSEIEESEFKTEISNSEQLKNQISEFEKELRKIKETNNLELNENYFHELRFKVHERISTKQNKIKYISRFAFTLTVTVIMIFAISKDFNDDEQNKYLVEPISWEEYFSTSDADLILPSTVNPFDELEEISVEEKLIFVNTTIPVSNSDVFFSVPDIDNNIIAELENKKIL
ncbi:MAG: hypothetical protein Fur0015_12130 [Ignavibacteriales bacterium]